MTTYKQATSLMMKYGEYEATEKMKEHIEEKLYEIFAANPNEEMRLVFTIGGFDHIPADYDSWYACEYGEH